MATVKVNLKLENQEFDKNLKQTEKELQRTKRNVNTLSKSMELNPNFDNVFSAFKEVVNAITLNQEKLEDLQAELKKMENAGEINTDRYKKLQEALYKTELDAKQLEVQLEKVTKNVDTTELITELKKSEETIIELKQKTQDYHSELEKLNAQNITIDNDFKETSEELKKAEQETKKLEVQLAKLGKTKINTKEYKDLQKQLDLSTKKTDTINKKLNELSKQKLDVNKEIKQVEKELKQCETTVKQYTNQVKLASSETIKTKQSQENLEKLSITAKETSNSLTDLGKAFAPISAAATGALYGIAKFTKDTVKSADDITTSAERIGISAENFQKWKYIGEQTNIELKELETGFRNLNGTIADLATGKVNESTKALQALGIDSKQALKGLDGNLDKIVDSLMKVENPTQRLALANELFGKKVGQAVIPMLNQGADGINKLKEEFNQLGYITNEQADTLATYGSELKKLRQAFKNIKNQLAIAFLPVFQKITNFIEKKVVPTLKKLTDKLKKLGTAPKAAILGILGFIAVLAPILLLAPKLFKAFKTLSSGVKLLRGGISKLNTSLMKLLANPVVLVIVAIVAVIVLLYMKCKEFRDMVNSLFKTIYQAIKPLLQTMKNFYKTIGKAFGQIISILVDSLMPVINILMDMLKPIIDIIMFLANILGKILAPILKVLMLPILIPLKIFISMLKSIMPVIKQIIDLLRTKLAPVFQFVGKVFQSVGKIIGGVFKFILKAIEFAVNAVIKVINFLLKPINAVIKFFGGKPIEINEVSLSGAKEENNPNDLYKEADKRDREKDKANPYSEAGKYASGTSTNNNYNYTTTNNYNNDASTINVTVENYGAEADPVELARQIKLKLIRGNS